MKKALLGLATLFLIGVLVSGCGETAKLTSSLSQPSGVTLQGTVYELLFTNGTPSTILNGNVIPNVEVHIEGSSGTYTTTSNSKGEYVFTGIPDGSYIMKVAAEGYSNASYFVYESIFWVERIPLWGETIKPFWLRASDNAVTTGDIFMINWPVITGFAPAHGSVISTDQNFSVDFSEAMDTSSVRFQLIPVGIRSSAAESGDTVQLDVSWSNNDATANITPEGNLIPNEVYVLALVPEFDMQDYVGAPYDSKGNPAPWAGWTWLSTWGYPEADESIPYYAEYRTVAGGVPAAPSNLQVLINEKTTSEVDFDDFMDTSFTIRLSWDPSSSGNITGYRVYAAQSGSLNNYVLLRDISNNTWTTDNYFTSTILKLIITFHGQTELNPVSTQNYPFVNNTIYFKVVAYNGDGESEGAVIWAKDAIGPQGAPGTQIAPYAGELLDNDYYLPPIDVTETARAYVLTNEPVDPSTVITDNFKLDGGLEVVSATLLSSFADTTGGWVGPDFSVIEITASGNVSGRTLIMSNVKDLAGNPVQTGVGDSWLLI